MPPSFSYWSHEAIIPRGHELWAHMDTGTWTLTFPDGREARYQGFDEIHQMLGETMTPFPGEREMVTREDDEIFLQRVKTPEEQWEGVGRTLMEFVSTQEQREAGGKTGTGEENMTDGPAGRG